MINRSFVLLLAATACGCSSQDSGQIDVDQTFTAEMASTTISEAPFDFTGYKIHAVCGPSEGQSLFLLESGELGSDRDGISEGRQIFVSEPNGDPDFIFRDAGGSYYSAKDDGGDVSIVGKQDRTVWVVSYMSNGVVETHQVFDKAGAKVNIWTSNKPISLFDLRSARAFYSNCYGDAGYQSK